MSLQEPNWDVLLSLHPGLSRPSPGACCSWPQRFDDAPQPKGEDLLTVAEVATRLRVHPRWVYAHQAELGAIKLGTGPKARLRFDPHVVEAHLLPNDAVPSAIAVLDAYGEAGGRRRRRLKSRPLPALDRPAHDR